MDFQTKTSAYSIFYLISDETAKSWLELDAFFRIPAKKTLCSR